MSTSSQTPRLKQPESLSPLSPVQREAVAAALGDAKPVGPEVLATLAQATANVREHEHPEWEDLYCFNLVAYMGERMAPVLRRLLDTEARVAELEAAPTTVYRAEHQDAGITLGHYATQAAARAHCEAMVRQEEPAGSIRNMSWWADDIGEDAVYELHFTPAETGSLIRGTGYVVTPLEVASEHDEEADE
ncbi:hypothetical protein [Streptomyces sp. NPDC046821]|uniref:hypothetical protein n=1 Tax=Streptomyces sp. NPDC046821 TaxID=3154702 RepID=UPI0033C1A7AA